MFIIIIIETRCNFETSRYIYNIYNSNQHLNLF